MMPHDADYSLVCPFLDDSPSFAAGVEFGMLYARMRGLERAINDYVTIANQEQVTLAANRLGWRVVRMEPWEGAPDQWFRLVMRRP